MRRSLATCLVTLAALSCLALATLAGLAAGLHTPAAPPGVLRAGPLAVSVEITHNPYCTPLMIGCFSVPPPGAPRYLSVWGYTYRDGGREVTGHSLLRMPLGP